MMKTGGLAKIHAALAAVLLAGCAAGTMAPVRGEQAAAIRLTPQQVDRVGRRIWLNECGGKVEGLTSWNAGEDFASLGIGHFIWYPAGRRGPFDESFPPLARYLRARGAPVSDWMTGPCPWPSREAFLADRGGARQAELRKLLAGTVREQTEFIMRRSREALPKMLAQAGPRANVVRANYEMLAATPEGTFALIDYVNFKGEGTAESERYRGQGWGLLQVLETMRAGSAQAAPGAFADAAVAVLERRVRNSPPERGEQRWMAGWRNRCLRYKDPL
jgi:hypothetical protein